MKKFMIKWVLTTVLDLISVALNKLAAESDTPIDDAFVITFAEQKEFIAEEVLKHV